MVKREQGNKAPATKGIGRVRKQRARLPGSFQLSTQALKTLRTYWKPLGGIMLVYLILNIIFVSGFSSLSSSVSDIKANLDSGNRFWNALGGFGTLLSGGVGSSQAASVMQSLLIILVSLVIIWALRQLLAGNSTGVKEAYYHAMTPLVPFLLVLVVIFLQLLPLTLGSAIVGTVLSTVFTPSGLLTAILIFTFVALAAWSVYMISSSIFALYIVTLPDTRPLQALRSAKNLVKFRRWQLMRRVVFLPIFILAAMALLIVPLILLASFLVVPVFYILSMLAILFTHTYLYSLYRSLLD